MCEIASIRLLVLVMGYLKAVLALYLFFAGFTISNSSDILKGLGLGFIEFGVGLVFLGLISGLVILPMRFGVSRHNRFLLVVSFFFDMICFIGLISISKNMSAYLDPLFPKELQLDCLRNTPLIYTAEECAPYLDSDRVAGMRLVWESYYIKKADKRKNQVLSQMELTCCGFFAPFVCIPNDASFPKDRDTKGISKSYLKDRVTCGVYENFYPERDDCTSYYDFALGKYLP